MGTMSWAYTQNLRITIKGWRRFCVCAGRNRAAVSRKRKNVGEQNAAKGVPAPLRTPGWCFANPEPPSGGVHLPFVICRAVYTLQTIFYNKNTCFTIL
jgi:hypothetical protein